MKIIRQSLLLIYFFILFFYGIFIKFLYGTQFIDYLKFIPEFILIIYLLILPKLRNGKIYVQDFTIIILLFIVYFSSLGNVPNVNSVLISVRDILFPILSLIIIKNSGLSEDEIKSYSDIFAVFSIVYLALSLFFGYLQHSNGLEYTAEFYTGHYFYGQDDSLSIKLTTVNGQVRSLGLVGASAKYGFYSLIAMIVIVNRFKSKFILNICFLVTLLNCYFSTNKTSIVISIILYFFLGSKFFKGFISKITVIFTVLGIIIFGISVVTNLEDYASIGERLLYWTSYDYFSLSNLIIGTDLFTYFNGGWFSIMDNTYLFGACCLGIVGYLYLLFYFIKNSWNISVISQAMLVIFLIGGMTTNMFSGRSFIGLFCLLCGLEYVLKKNETVKKMIENK